MPIPDDVINRVEGHQHAAAHDDGPQVHVVAGPGTGKSRAIEERVRHLLDDVGVDPAALHVISFTNASVRDLADRIGPYCQERGVDASGVSTTTLHSLALRLLRQGRLLTHYPVDPLVLDEWETRNLVDEEFKHLRDCGIGRAKDVRRDFEAMANRNAPLPTYDQPEEPVTDGERSGFVSFMQARRSLYACVLAGELVRECVGHMDAGSLDPVALLGLEHLIVDEYQDLNPADVQFIDYLTDAGVTTYVCGDDDQSLYSFRDAYPAGIRKFPSKHPDTSKHTLEDCFRCAPKVLSTAMTLIEAFSAPDRLEKHHRSLWDEAEPPVEGHVHRWKFRSHTGEANAIADSCKKLHAAGVDYDDIFVLLADQNVQPHSLYQAFEKADVPVVRAREETFVDTDPGRAVLSVLRIACRDDDLVAHRVLFGLMDNVGPATCCGLVEQALVHSVPPKLLFADGHEDVMPTKVSRHLGEFAAGMAPVNAWEADDTLDERRDDIAAVLDELASHHSATEAWNAEVDDLPGEMTLREVRDYLGSSTAERAIRVLEAVYDRLGQELPDDVEPPEGVRFMSIHGSKGLDAKVVFIPGIEQEILPGTRREHVAGKVFEAARMLYVAITRTKAACILSWGEFRYRFGENVRTTPSTFLPHLSGRFDERRDERGNDGLTDAEAEAIAAVCEAMKPPSS